VPVVRELTTVLNFKTDSSGLNQYESQVKQSTQGITTGLVAVGSAIGNFIANIAQQWLAKIQEFVSKAIESANELVRLSRQVAQTLRSGDAGQFLDDVFQAAQRVGAEYGTMLGALRTWDTAMRGTKVSTDTLTAAYESMQMAMAIGGATAEQTTTFLGTMTSAIKAGSLSESTFVDMLYSAPQAARALEEALGKTTAEVRQMAKDNKLSSEVILNAFAKMTGKLREEFLRTSVTFGFAATRIGNIFTRLAAWFLGAGEAGRSNWIAEWAVRATDAVVHFGESVISALGGASKAFEFLTYAAGVALVTVLIANLPTVIRLVTTLAEVGVLFTLKWGAILAVVGLLVLGIQDLVYWMKGRGSVLGDFFGPFSEVWPKIMAFLAPFIKIVNEVIQMIQKMGEAFGIHLTTSQAAVILVIGAFGGLSAIIKAVILSVRILGFSIGLLNFIPLGGLMGTLMAITAAIAPIAAFLAILLYPRTAHAATMDADYQKYAEQQRRAGYPALPREEWQNQRLQQGWAESQRDAEGNIIGNNPGAMPAQEPSWWDRFRNWYRGETAPAAPAPSPTGPAPETAPTVPTVPPAATTGDMADQIRSLYERLNLPVPQALQVAPGSVAGPGATTADVTQNANVTTTNNITVTGTIENIAEQIRSGVESAMAAANAAAADATARALANSAPKVEAPTK
jgi:tape measure domain-containing protein